MTNCRKASHGILGFTSAGEESREVKPKKLQGAGVLQEETSSQLGPFPEKVREEKEAHLEILHQASTGHFGAIDLLLQELAGVQHKRDQLQQLLLELVCNV